MLLFPFPTKQIFIFKVIFLWLLHVGNQSVNKGLKQNTQHSNLLPKNQTNLLNKKHCQTHIVSLI